MADIPARISKEITDRFQVVNNSFARAVKDNPKDRIQVEIGDSKQPDFKPQVKIMRWDNEVNFSLRAQEDPNATVEVDKGVIKYKTPDYEVHQYELDPGDIGEDGGLEFEWVLPRKPATNVLTATIQTKGLNFYYQPPLTPEEVEQGASRPENVVGSYAVYHKTKGGMNRADGMEYKTGKAFHIYRPKVTDANGNETWGELNVDEQKGELNVTIDQTWLDNAVYPVVVDPTFGYTSIGASNALAGANVMLTTNASITEGGSVISISVYGKHNGSAMDIKPVIYNDGSSDPGTRNSVGTPATAPATEQWNVLTHSATLTTGAYWLSFIASASAFRWYYDSSPTPPGRGDSNNYATPTDPWDTAGDFVQNLSYSIYATYTASGGGAAPPKGFMTTNTSFWGS